MSALLVKTIDRVPHPWDLQAALLRALGSGPDFSLREHSRWKACSLASDYAGQNCWPRDMVE